MVELLYKKGGLQVGHRDNIYNSLKYYLRVYHDNIRDYKVSERQGIWIPAQEWMRSYEQARGI